MGGYWFDRVMPVEGIRSDFEIEELGCLKWLLFPEENR
jgi:hypothetical protein